MAHNNNVILSVVTLKSNWLKFKTSRNLFIILEDYMEYTSIKITRNHKMGTWNWLDLERIG